MDYSTAFVFLLSVTVALSQNQCPPNEDRCPTSPPYKSPTITTSGSYRYVETTGCPPYDNPRWTNPVAACIQNKQYVLPLNPTRAQTPIPVGEPYGRYDGILYLKESPAPIFGALGVLTNGVLVFGVGSPCGYSSKCPEDGAPTKYVDAVESEGYTVDQCGGHAAPTNNQYHIHSNIGINTTTGQKQCLVNVDVPGQHSPLIGWIFDGFGLYGQYSVNGVVPTDLDQCGGHTHDINGSMVYHYHMPTSFPWTIGCFTGCPYVENNPREFANISQYGCPDDY